MLTGLPASGPENDLIIAYVLETHRQEDVEFGSRTLAQVTGTKIVGSIPTLAETDAADSFHLWPSQNWRLPLHQRCR